MGTCYGLPNKPTTMRSPPPPPTDNTTNNNIDHIQQQIQQYGIHPTDAFQYATNLVQHANIITLDNITITDLQEKGQITAKIHINILSRKKPINNVITATPTNTNNIIDNQ
jgi:hypothetical protein